MVDPVNRPPTILRHNMQIVGPDGAPTRQFIQLWNQQRALNKSTEEVVAELNALDAQVELNRTDIDTLLARIVQGTAGRITGGGSLASGDITLDLAASGVTPGSYNNADVTVDAFGRVTAAANGSSGGGGGGTLILGQTVASNLALGAQIDLDLDDTLYNRYRLYFEGSTTDALNVALQFYDNVPAVQNVNERRFTLTDTGVNRDSQNANTSELLSVFASSNVSGKRVTIEATVLKRTDGRYTARIELVAGDAAAMSSCVTVNSFTGDKIGLSSNFGVGLRQNSRIEWYGYAERG